MVQHLLGGKGGPVSDVLGCSSDDPLKCFNLSLRFQGFVLPHQLLFSKASILNAIRVIEKKAGFLVLELRSTG